MSKHLHIDPFSGICGDMFVGACIDLGVPVALIDSSLRPLGITPDFRLEAAETFRHSIRGIDFKVRTEAAASSGETGPASHRHPPGAAHAGAHGTGTFRAIMGLIDRLDVRDETRQIARSITRHIATAEAHVHGIPIDHVHFHEVGAVDSIVDILGSAIAIGWLGVTSVSCAPLPIGHGFVRCAHGVMPLPAPATAEILRHIPHHGVPREGETVTPTGAAIVAAIAGQFGPMPPMHVERVGYGAGDRDPADAPNLLRLFLGVRR